MVRLHQDQATQLLILLSWAHITGQDLNGIHAYVSRTNPFEAGSESGKRWREVTRDYFENRHGRTPSLELIKTLVEAVRQGNAGAYDGDLIDQVVRILTGPYSRNALSGSALRQLQDAVLLPEEAAKLRNEVRPRELSCGLCGRPFGSREVATFVNDAHAPYFACAQCEPPVQDKCPKCRAVKVMNKRLMNAIKKTEPCDECQQKIAKGEPVTRIEEGQPEQGPIGQEAGNDPRRYVAAVEGVRRAGRAGTLGDIQMPTNPRWSTGVRVTPIATPTTTVTIRPLGQWVDEQSVMPAAQAQPAPDAMLDWERIRAQTAERFSRERLLEDLLQDGIRTEAPNETR